MKEKLSISLSFCILASLLMPAFFFKISFIYFAPFIVLLFLYDISFEKCLWLASIIGLFFDIKSSTLFGIHTLVYLFATIFAFYLKKFFNKRIFNICLYSSIYSIIFLIFNYLFLLIFNKNFKPAFFNFAYDLLLFPIVNGIYSYFSSKIFRAYE